MYGISGKRDGDSPKNIDGNQSIFKNPTIRGFLRERGNWEAWNLRVGRLGNPIGNRKEDDRDPYLGQRIP